MEKSAEEIRDSIKAAGLTAISAHVSYDELAGDLKRLCRTMKPSAAAIS